MNKWSINDLFGGFISSHCLLCDSPAGEMQICRHCLDSLPRSKHRCSVCALPLAGSQPLCGHCLSKKPYFDQCVALLDYAYPVDYLIQKLKYRQKLPFARLLGQILCDPPALETFPTPLPQLILPVPLHYRRLKQRGFNQSIELSRRLSKVLRIPLDTSSCVRLINTQQQSTIPAAKRIRNIKQAFKLISKPEAKHIAIVDDVMTTGATANELARVLKLAGVERISVWVLARAK